MYNAYIHSIPNIIKKKIIKYIRNNKKLVSLFKSLIMTLDDHLYKSGMLCILLFMLEIHFFNEQFLYPAEF